MKNDLISILGVKYPIIQAGMVWCSGWKLASAVSEEGGLGTIGSGSMYPEVLEEHLWKMNKATDANYAVNLPLIYPQVEDHLHLIKKFKVPVVITSAGNPSKYAEQVRSADAKLLHVVANEKFAQKAIASGCNAIIAEGVEAGGHNSRDEITTMCLVPRIAAISKIPVVAAGGIASGRSMAAAFALGAQGVQVGSRFAACVESSAHKAFKDAVLSAKDSDTVLTLKELVPVRLLKNTFYSEVVMAYEKGATKNELKELLGKGRAKQGIFEGDLEGGELEIGQVAGSFRKFQSAKAIMKEMLSEYNQVIKSFQKI